MRPFQVTEMKFWLGLFLLLTQCAAVSAAALTHPEVDYSAYVVKVQAIRPDQVLSTGSAVTIAPGRMITNCHVIRDAREIWVTQGGQTWKASHEVGDAYRDLCILDIPDYVGEVPVLAHPSDTRVGIDVLAAGFSSNRFSVTQGKIKRLYSCPCDGGNVIQTSASFDRGGSGGGLFDREGRLVGILTFKSTAGGDFHFALPVGWLGHLARQGVTNLGGGQAFWEQNPRNSGYFLAACALEVKEDWPQLGHLALEWTRSAPSDPEAWMSLGRAKLGLGHQREAAKAFQHVLMLDSIHPEAQWELQKLEFDLDEDLIDPYRHSNTTHR